MKLGKSIVFCSLLFVLTTPLSPPAFADRGDVQWVKMSDGVALHTIVFLPGHGVGPWPVLLARSPYENIGDDDLFLTEILPFIGLVGFAAVLQYTRGFGGSEGEPTPFLHDQSDGRETVEWLLDQEWCDGRVFVFGASALGIPAYLLSPTAPEEMSCQTVLIATPDVFGAAFQGGVFKQHDVERWGRWLGRPAVMAEIPYQRDCDEFWESVIIDHLGADVRTAALHVGGWYDLFAEGTLAAFKMYGESDCPWAARHQYLVMGPWEHNKLGSARAGELRFPPDAGYDLVALFLPWLRWCKSGGPAQGMSWPRVRYYTMGSVESDDAPGNEWREADDWPPFDTVATPLYVAADGALAWQPPREPLKLEIAFDPADPSPTRCGRNLSLASGPCDQQAVEERADAVVFTTAPLEEPLEATGLLSMTLAAATPDRDADLAVRVTDVYPDGRSMLVGDGIMRLSRRGGCRGALEVTPGEFYELEIPLFNTSYIWNRGHRIRVVLTAGNYPRFEINPAHLGEDGSPGAATTVHVLTGPEKPAALFLPLPAPKSRPVDEGEVVEVPVAEPVAEPVVTPDVVTPDVSRNDLSGPLPQPSPDSRGEDPWADDDVAAVPCGDTSFEGADTVTPGTERATSGGCATAAPSAGGRAPKVLVLLLLTFLARAAFRHCGMGIMPRCS